MNNTPHWYDPKTATAVYEVPKADGKGMRKATIADARKLGLYPGVTGVLNVLSKPQLTNWLIDQAVSAVLTAPRLDGEDLDAFKHRVLETEKQQHEEAETAADLGTSIHDAIANFITGKGDIPSELVPWIRPAVEALQPLGKVICAERILVGPGYAGRTDLILGCPTHDLIVDFKTTKKVPEKESWKEHRLQLAAYARAWRLNDDASHGQPVQTANCYISTAQPGEFKLHLNPPWRDDYEKGFAPVFHAWCWMNNYWPNT